MKKYAISLVSTIFFIVNISITIIFYFIINFDSIEAGYLILQFQLLLFFLFIVLKYHLGNLKTIHVKYFTILPITKIYLLFNTFSLLFRDIRFILIVFSFLLADYFMFGALVINFYIFIICFVINI